MTLHQIYTGIDVSKAHLDVFDPRTGASRVPNTPEALIAFAHSLIGEDIVVLEATGSYDRALCAALGAAGIGFVRVNPRRARDFARSTGKLAKTDRLDAKMLSRMGKALSLVPGPAQPHPARVRLTALARRRDQLVAIRAREANHAETAQTDMVEHIAHHIGWLNAQIGELDAAIAAVIETDESLRTDNALLRSAPGVGPVAATTLLALMPEMGALTDKAVAALCGLAPINRDSGTLRGKRSIGPGRRRVRTALYMAALNAVRCNQRFKATYKTLRDRGKPAKLALIAIARKLIVTLNAMVKNQKPFNA